MLKTSNPEVSPAKDMEKAPEVSVVMATYNRSNILQFSIGSLLRGSYQDWELIVVGDFCTDDSADVVSGFNDPRIRFVNMTENCGEQTGPNNLGVELARGRYMAFLNHDDMWFPDHLQRSISILDEDEDVELVFGQGLVISSNPPNILLGALCDQRQKYEPWMIVPASLWVMRREFAERIGPWKPSWLIRVMPSQEWLYRACRQEACMVADPALCAVIINSGDRVNSYRDRQDSEHKYWYPKLADDAFFKQVLAAMFGAYLSRPFVNFRGTLRDFVAAVGRKGLLAVNVWPPSPYYWIKFWRKGSFLRKLRRVRGLEERS